MSPVPSIEVESTNTELLQNQDSSEHHLHYVSDLLSRSVAISKNLYERTGLKNEFLEQKALRVNEVSTQFANLIDNHIDVTVARVQTTTKKISKRTSETSLELLNRAKETQVVKTADSLTNRFLVELENQVAGLSQFVQKRHGRALPESEQDSEESSEVQKPVKERVQQLLITLNEIGKLIADSYTEQAKNTRVFRAATEASDAIVAYSRKSNANIVSLAEVLYFTVLKEGLFDPLFNSLQVNYVHAKDTVTVTINNIRKADVDGLLVKAKDSYASLKEASISTFSKNQLSFIFSKSFFIEALSRIQSDIAQLLTDVTAMKAHVQNAVLELYTKSVQEFKRRRENRINGNNKQQNEVEVEQQSPAQLE